MTRQRRLIWDIIQQSSEHMTADQVYAIAKEQLPSIAIGTVYRNLNLMVEKGEIVKVSVVHAPDRYDRTIKQHEHMICSSCGALKDVEVVGLKAWLEKQTGARIDSYDLNMYYVCPSCYNKEKERKL